MSYLTLQEIQVLVATSDTGNLIYPMPDPDQKFSDHKVQLIQSLLDKGLLAQMPGFIPPMDGDGKMYAPRLVYCPSEKGRAIIEAMQQIPEPVQVPVWKVVNDAI